MNKQKLIYVEDLEEALYDEPCDVCDGQNDNGGYWGFSRDALNEIIKIVPTVDAKPVVHGHWMNGRFNGWNNNVYEEQCSVCGRYSRDYRDYCSNCGARMDEVVE